MDVLTVDDVVQAVSAQRSSWGRPDVIQAICDRQRPVSQLSGRRWLDGIERSADRVLEHLVDLDPPSDTLRRASDGRSVWIEPTAPRFTSEAVLAQEEDIITWAMAAQADPPAPSTTVDRSGLDVMQGEAAAAVAGHDRLVLVVGPAGAGKTRMLTAAGNDLHDHGRGVFGLAPTATAARNLERDTGIRSDTVAKLLHEWQRTDRPPLDEYRLGPGATLIVDEAGMLSTPDLHRVVRLADGEPVAAGARSVTPASCKASAAAACSTSCAPTGGSISSNACTASSIRGRPPRRCWCEPVTRVPSTPTRRTAGSSPAPSRTTWRGWPTPGSPTTNDGRTAALVASTNDHVDTINRAVQQARLDAGHLDPDTATRIAGGEHAHVGDVVATRRNDRRLTATGGEPVRNRDTWTVTGIGDDGSLTVSHHRGHGDVTLPVDYTRQHVRLGYVATEHGWESGNVTAGISLVSSATTRRGLYVAVTRGGEENVICVITDSDDIAEARDVLDGIVAIDRADIPAVTQRRSLAQQLRDQAPSQPTPPAPRCVIPDWFPSLLARRTQRPRCRRATSDGERRATSTAARRHRRRRPQPSTTSLQRPHPTATPTHAPSPAPTTPADTRPPRNAVSTRRRVEPVARLRHELDVAERRQERADAYLERTRQRTEPSIEQYRQAQAHRRAAQDNLRHRDAADLLDAMHHPVDVCRQRVAALDTWQRWANGHHVDTNDLRAAVDTLNSMDGSERPYAEALVGSLQQWAIHNHVDLTAHPRPAPAIQTAGIEIEL